ncbi:hypothetical protein JCM9279_006184 [Rhodotorula babjevae]
MAHPHGGAKARDAALDSAARRQHSTDEGVPRYDPHANQSTVNLHPHDAHDRRAASEVDERAWRSKAEVEEWRSAHLERRASVARSTASGRSSAKGGGSSSGAQETLGGLSEADLAPMSDAEIAQHHFRLAQQHLEAAQRLSLAAAETSSRYARSTQSSSVGSLRSPQARFAHEHDSAASSACGESSFGQDDQLRSPVSVSSSASPIERDLRRLSIDRHGSSSGPGSYDERRRSALQIPAATRALEPPPNVLPSPSSHFSTSPSSISLRSAPSLPHRTAEDTRAVPQRPVPPPRRATVGAATSQPATFESASALAPSLYGGCVPLGVPDRPGVRSASAGSSLAGSAGVSRSASSSSSSSPHWPAAQPRDPLEQRSGRSLVEHDAADRAEDDDDTTSDFFDAQSTISHVTNSPLPSYSDPYMRPAVPSIPEEYLRPVASAPPASVVGDTSGPPSPSPSHEPLDDFHGFRPRHALLPQHYSPQPPSHPAHPPHQTHSSSSHPPVVAHGPPPLAPIYANPVAALNGAQPHSYILGADGRPIPVYSAPTGPHYRAGQPAPRSALPIHSQPLQFDHSLPYTHRPPQPTRGPVVTTAGVHPTLTAHASPLQPYSPHASPLTPSALPTLSPRPSTASFAPFTVGLVPRPPSPSSSTTTTHRAPSISGRSRMASLRAAVKSPHVRFMSPSPEARSRASEPPPTSSSTLASSRSGRVGSSSGGSAAAAARGRMGSFFGASASGGDALRMEHARAVSAVPEVDDEESEAERRKRQGEAMQQSFGMLL